MKMNDLEKKNRLSEEQMSAVSGGLGAVNIGFCCGSFELHPFIRAAGGGRSQDEKDCNYCAHWLDDECRCEFGFHEEPNAKNPEWMMGQL